MMSIDYTKPCRFTRGTLGQARSNSCEFEIHGIRCEHGDCSCDCHLEKYSWEWHFFKGLEHGYPICCILWYCSSWTNMGEQRGSLYEFLRDDLFTSSVGDHVECPECLIKKVNIMISNNQDPITKEQIMKNPSWVKKIFMMCSENQKKSNAKVKVGCVVQAIEYRKDSSPIFDFHGCNIHVSDSFGDTHAERMAIDFALKEKCYPIAIFVTSTSETENIILCGSCRHYISEINENCLIVIFNPDGSIKVGSTIKDVYPNHKEVTKKNKMFMEYCKNEEVIK